MTEVKETRNDMITRDAILMMLSDDEVASVSTAEAAVTLPPRSEYIDLDRLELGVQQSSAAALAMGRILPKKAVHADTWRKIQTALAGFNAAKPPTR